MGAVTTVLLVGLRLTRCCSLARSRVLFFLLLAFTSPTGFSAQADWRLVPNGGPEGSIWVDASSVRFEGSNVIISIKVEKQAGRGFGLISANCANFTILDLGGEWHDKTGGIERQSPKDKPAPAPSGTTAGTIHRFVCDLRPAWRRWFQ